MTVRRSLAVRTGVPCLGEPSTNVGIWAVPALRTKVCSSSQRSNCHGDRASRAFLSLSFHVRERIVASAKLVEVSEKENKTTKQGIVHRLCKNSKDVILGGTIWVGTQKCRRRAANHRALDDKLRAYARRRSQ
jgi:hypothetical protein